MFLTNNKTYRALEIAELYKKRWEIEVFFNFLKQNLNFSHLLSHHYNGMQVEMYMALISAILILVYKKENNLSGYKITKLKMALELESLLIKEVVIICGGDPNKADDVWAPS
ncbi:transposase [Ursidibacter maritimus]|uniref:transposase n=1 Tax=Ursidibacter maritimus TaxID=1331689 RepID=UPI0022B7C3F5|nr:transposase [Ursidibacter maritimus]